MVCVCGVPDEEARRGRKRRCGGQRQERNDELKKKGSGGAIKTDD